MVDKETSTDNDVGGGTPVTCSSGKASYPTRSAAIKAIKTIRNDTAHARQVRPTNQYRCPECGQWHLTHQRDTRRKASPRPQSDNLRDQMQADLDDFDFDRFGGYIPNIRF